MTIKPDRISATDRPTMLDRLERLLRGQLINHNQLLECIRRKREAIRHADIDEMTAISEKEHGLTQRLSDLERQRLEIVGWFTECADNQAAHPLTLTQIAEGSGDRHRVRLLALAAELRGVMQEAKRESSIVRAAAEALSRHMAGLMQLVSSSLSGTRLYESRGRVASGAQFQFAVDLKS